MSVTLVVLSRYPDLFNEFAQNVYTFAPEVPKILIRSGKEPGFMWCDPTWTLLHGPEPFVYSRSVNFGWEAAKDADVLLCGDDIRFETPFVKELQEVAYSDPKIGFAVPELGGQSAFVCAYIKRQLINEVGPMDERFDGYGYQDNDYYRRFEALGWKTKPTTAVKAKHSGGTSFYRLAQEEGGESIQAQCDRMKKLYEEKWGV
jgi:hypothetical protein